jgi:hypothetical protein
MGDNSDENWREWVAFNLRRAGEERRKAERARGEHERDCRLIIAEIFEARARDVPAEARADVPELEAAPTMH